MQFFYLTLTQMLMMFSFMLIGFFLRKKNFLAENSHITMSKLETFIFVPALNLSNMLKNCNTQTFRENAPLILYGAGVIFIALIIAQPLSALFVRNSGQSSELSYQRNIYRYALTFGNYGFVGNFLILGIWGSEVFFKYTMFTLIPAIVCSGWGMYVLIPKDKGDGIMKKLVKGVVKPPLIALVTGIILGLAGAPRFIPEFVYSTLSNASSCMGPVSMLLAGFVIGGFSLKEMVSNKKIYITAIFRLILIPALFVTVGKLLNISDDILLFAFVLLGTPVGLNTIVYPAAFGGDTKTGASMAMISNTLCVITIPVMYLLLLAA